MPNKSVLDSLHSELKQEMDVHMFLKECCEHLNILFKFEIMAYMLIDEQDQSFHLSHCEPSTQDNFILNEVDYQIEQGVFAWVLSQTKPVFEKTQDQKKTLILHALATRFRLKGMFIGVADQYEAFTTSNSAYLFSMILQSVSNVLENHELYQSLHRQNMQLEETIAKRTAELEVARLEAEKANQTKSQFLANISHEIRTPLTVILGYADLIRYQQLSPIEQEVAITNILQTSKHLSNLVNNILDISKIEAGKLEVEIIQTHLFSLLDEITLIVREQAKEKGLLFKTDIQFPLPEWINTDPTRLKQILLNLSNNAVKFTEAGEISISVCYQPELENIVFSVMDSGTAIALKDQDKLFQKFVQIDGSTTRRFGGSGLGLAISRQLAEKLGGTLIYQSAPGKGNCFCVTLNCGVINHQSLIYDFCHLPEPVKRINSWPMSGKLFGLVLLAEDNVNSQQLISIFLTKAGLSVDIADNGNDVVEKALTNSYDIILMDMQMPGMNGIEATILLRNAGYMSPIVALTANATVESKRECHEAGFDGFLSKPIDVESFFNILSQYCHVATGIDDITPPIVSTPDFQDILKEFIEELPKTIKDMNNAYNQENWQALKSLAHQLKGVAGGYGYPELGKTACLIEEEINQGNVISIGKLLKNIHHNVLKI